MRRLFKRLGIFREGVAIETQSHTRTSERGFREVLGALSLWEANLWKSHSSALDLLQPDSRSTASCFGD